MNNRIFFPQQAVQVPIPAKGTQSQKPFRGDNEGFGKILEQNLNKGLKFSRHARERLEARNIRLTADKLDRLEDAVGKARAKGARDSLVLMDDLALVVSIKNNTVVTAVDGHSIKENVFTNIDSAVLI
jgi:flagellar operon protein